MDCVEGWGDFEDEQTEQCRKKEGRGRAFYNSAFMFMFIGLGFSIVAYSVIIAIIVAGLGIGFEGWQWYNILTNRQKVSDSK